MITSNSNQKIKDIRKMRDRKGQKESPFFFMEGIRIVGEALAQNCPLEMLIYSPELVKNEYALGLIDQCLAKKIETLDVSADVFSSISVKDHPQGIAAVGRKLLYALEDLPLQGIFIVLQEIADPGNLGTIIRTADAIDSTGVILLGETVDPYHISAVRGSMGALFSQRIVRTDWGAFLRWKNKHNVQLMGASDRAQDVYLSIPVQNPVALLMGSEREGLTDEQMNVCDSLVRIPMMRSSDSLNLSVATGIMAYYLFHSHQGYRWEKKS